MKNSGVYKIQNVVNGKQYIGSAVNIDRRWNRHLHSLRRGVHENEYLQRAFNKYGENAFKFMILEVVLFPEGLIPLEQKYLDELNPEYNICTTAGNCLGRECTEETKLRISKSLKGNHYLKMREAQKGKHHSEETKLKISEAMKGKQNSLGKQNTLGYHHSEEYKRHMSELKKENKNMLGKHHSEESRQKMSETHKGRIVTEETKQKISGTLKKYWEQRRRLNEEI